MIKKVYLSLLCLALVVGAFLPEGRSSASAGSVTIAADTINVRNGPGLSYSLIQVAKRGEKYKIVREKGDWIEIQLSLIKTGWVVNWLVSKDSQNQSTSAAAASKSITSAKAVADQLRIRSGPGTNFQIIGFLTNGQAVSVLDQNENWYKISSPFGDGWVTKEFIQLQSSQVSQTPSGSLGVVNGDILNIRREPSTTSVVIGKLTKGTKVTIDSKQGSWLKISFSSINGWVSSEFIDSAGQTGASQSSAGNRSGNIIGTVTVSGLNIRNAPSLNSQTVGTVSKGSSFSILAENNGWAKIEYQAGRFGWAAGWFLSRSTSKTDSGTGGQQAAVTILQDGTNIRTSPNVQSNVLARAKEGDTFSVVELQGDWYKIKLKNGAVGYVAGWMVSANGSGPQVEKAGTDSYLKNKVIVLDPGHGGGDNGTTGAAGTLEKELTLRTARLLYDKLKAAGANVILTRYTDTYLPLATRVSVSSYYHADAFVSLHYDSNVNRGVRGTTGYYYHNYQKSLADTLYTSTVSQTKLANRGVRFGDFHVIRENPQKAALMELGYLSNPEEEMTVKSRWFQENAATGLFNGLARFFKEGR